jgi:hypothetical protein
VCVKCFVIACVEIILKVNFALEQALKAYRGVEE